MAIHVQGYLRFKLLTEEVEELVKRFSKEAVCFLLQYAQGTGRGKELTFEIPLEEIEGVISQLVECMKKD